MLDLTPGRLSDSIKHADQALRSIESRLEELKLAKENPSSLTKAVKPDPKGKGKGKASAVAGINSDAVQNMSATQIEGELRELAELKEELALRVSIEYLLLLFFPLSVNDAFSVRLKSLKWPRMKR